MTIWRQKSRDTRFIENTRLILTSLRFGFSKLDLEIFYFLNFKIVLSITYLRKLIFSKIHISSHRNKKAYGLTLHFLSKTFFLLLHLRKLVFTKSQKILACKNKFAKINVVMVSDKFREMSSNIHPLCFSLLENSVRIVFTSSDWLGVFN